MLMCSFLYLYERHDFIFLKTYHLTINTNSRCIPNLNVKGKAISLLEDSKGGYIHDLGAAQIS